VVIFFLLRLDFLLALVICIFNVSLVIFFLRYSSFCGALFRGFSILIVRLSTSAIQWCLQSRCCLRPWKRRRFNSRALSKLKKLRVQNQCQ
jgi:hypothetical protein